MPTLTVPDIIVLPRIPEPDPALARMRPVCSLLTVNALGAAPTSGEHRPQER